jgi:hypothetical protein
MKRLIICLFVLLFSTHTFYGQELRCAVQVVAPSIQGTNRNVFESLRNAIYEFMNAQQWSNSVFAAGERIECTFLFTITEMVGMDQFIGSLQVQARRPVYNSAYVSPILNYKDVNIDFKYAEFEPLVYDPNNFDSNLVALLAYYANVILGLDYDTFSSEGGDTFYENAEKIVGRMQNAQESGWRSFESRRNRYWLVENMLNEYHSPLRECYYEYHRKGLDMMADKPEEGRSNVLAALELLQKVYRQSPNSFALRIFFDAKQQELVNVFSGSFSMEKGRVVTILSEIDPSNSDKYQELLKTQ